MKVNVHLSITDYDRNLIADRLDGKKSKRLVTRKEINELVAGFLDQYVRDQYDAECEAEIQAPARKEINELVAGFRAQAEIDFCSDDCCTRNELLQTRVNKLQHKLDTLK